MMETTLQNNKCKSLLSVYKWTLCRHKTPAIVLSVLLFCAGPLISILLKLFDISLAQQNQAIDGGFYNPNHIYAIDTMFFTLSGLVILFFTLFISITVFKYLHSKRNMDTFASLPVSRRTFFLGRYLAGLTMLLVPLLVNFLITLAITASCPLGGNNVLLTLLQYFLILVCIVTASYSLTAFIAVCCGTSASTVVSTIIINGAYPIVIYLAMLMFNLAIPGQNMMNALFSSEIPMIILFALSPYCMFTQFYPSLNMYLYETNETQASLNPYPSHLLDGCIYLLIFAVILTSITFILIKKRKTECAQSGFAFKVPVYVIRLITSVAAGLLSGGIFALTTSMSKIDNIYLFFAIGAFIGAFLAHLIVTVIFNAGFRGFLKSLIAYGVSMALITAWCLLVVTGFFNYDIYVPSESSIASVNISAHMVADGDYPDTMELKFTYTDSFDKITDIHKDISNNLRSTYHYPYLHESYPSAYFYSSTTYYRNYGMEDSEYSVNNIELEYTLKGGQKIKKAYDSRVLNSSIDKKIKDLLNTNYNEHMADALESANKSITNTNEYYSIEIFGTPKSNSTININSYVGDYAKQYQYVKDLLTALSKDIRSDKDITYEISAEDKESYPYINIETPNFFNCFIVVKGSYKNTLKELEKIEKDKNLWSEGSDIEYNDYYSIGSIYTEDTAVAY